MTTPRPIPALCAEGQVLAATRGDAGVITLNRPEALNALSLGMVRDLTTLLRHFAEDPAVRVVLLQAAARPGKAPAFCAGGDIRFFHQAAWAGDPRLGDFFTEEYRLNHLIHGYDKPLVAFMDGVVMGGGMGISQGARLRVVTEGSKLAMPETMIGLFPDVGGGWFLARCPGRTGEWLALTGHVLGAPDAIALGLADVMLPSAALGALAEALTDQPVADEAAAQATVRARAVEPGAGTLDAATRAAIDRHFALVDVAAILASLDAAGDDWSTRTAAALRQRSPLMLQVTLEQVRRARGMSLAEDLRMERDLVHHAFHLRPVERSQTVEGIRALAVDKDHHPRWNPATQAEVDPAEVAAFFVSPWAPHEHPLRDLA